MHSELVYESSKSLTMFVLSNHYSSFCVINIMANVKSVRSKPTSLI